MSESHLERIRSELDVDLLRRRSRRFVEQAVSQEWIEYAQIGFERQQSKNRTWEITFHYDAETPGRRHRRVQEYVKTEKLLNVLSTLNEEVAFDCEASFRYQLPPGNIPFRIEVGFSNAQGERPFDEIRGITVVKLENDQILYSVTMESLDLKVLSLEVSFGYRRRFSNGLPEEILQEGQQITSQFLE